MNICINQIKTDVKHYVTLSAALTIYLFTLCRMPVFCERSDMSQAAKASGSAEKSAVVEVDGNWVTIKSNFFEICYDKEVDLQAVTRKLGKRGLFLGGTYSPAPTGTPQERLAYMMDRLLRRAKEVLDMYPDISPTVKIKIFKTREEADTEYFRMFGARVNYKSYFIYELETIYTSEEDISDSVIAHEMGHMIIDHYFSIVPPSKVAELLAQYVDKHLED